MNLFSQIAGLRKNIAIDEADLERMTARWRVTGGCCPGCENGEIWSRTYDRLERRLAWLEILQFKAWRNAGSVGTAPRSQRSAWT